MTRFCATIAAGRLLRVACFMTTVLPNPRPGCYKRRFPPPPESTWEMLRVGFTTLRGHGGCNDLIFRCAAAPAAWCVCAFCLRCRCR